MIAGLEEHEEKFLHTYVSRETGRYIESLSCDSWREMSKEEWQGLLHTVVACWEERPVLEDPMVKEARRLWPDAEITRIQPNKGAAK